MCEWDANGKHFIIRQAEEDEYRALEGLQREVWDFSDLDIVPAATITATVHAGGCALGAFDGALMIGFAYGFPAFEHRRPSLHSHMLGVKPAYRDADAGTHLKRAQRDFALAHGFDEITWTFDPLQSRNAHLNFGKLGVISNQYFVNFYGEETSSPQHQGFGTDRLWVRWLLESERVKSHIGRDTPAARPTLSSLEEAQETALVYQEAEAPHLSDFATCLAANRCLIEIPHDIMAVKDRDPELGRAWREATRAAFLAGIEAGFTVADFLRADTAAGKRGFYLLTR